MEVVDYSRVLELMNYSKEAFDITEHFEFIAADIIMCSEEMCPDPFDNSLRIAWLMALGEYEQVESEFDYFRIAEFYEELQSAV